MFQVTSFNIPYSKIIVLRREPLWNFPQPCYIWWSWQSRRRIKQCRLRYQKGWFYLCRIMGYRGSLPVSCICVYRWYFWNSDVGCVVACIKYYWGERICQGYWRGIQMEVWLLYSHFQLEWSCRRIFSVSLVEEALAINGHNCELVEGIMWECQGILIISIPVDILVIP